MSMLEQAIIDAKELREVAKANAEAEVLEKYSVQIKEAVDRLLEQDEDAALDLDAAADEMPEEEAPEATEPEMPEAHASNAEVQAAADEIGNDTEAAIAKLENAIDDLESVARTAAELPMKADDDEIVELPLSDVVATDDDEEEEEEEEELPMALEEDIEVTTEMLDALAEALKVDVGPEKSGWAGTPDSQIFHQQELALAQAQSDELREENEEFKAAVKELTEAKETLEVELSAKNKLLENTMATVEGLQNKLSESLLINTKLFYSNKALNDSSLNERQRNKIVEAINRADTTDKVKVVFETLCETVTTEPAKNAGPENLTEALKVRTLVARSTKKETISESSDVLRMKRLAGIL